MKRATLRTRLLASFALVALTGAAAFVIAIRVMVPRLFDQETGNGNGNGIGGPSGQGLASQHDAVVSSVNTALVIALGASMVCSAAIAIALSRRGLRSLEAVRAGTRRLAAGRYDTPVARPHVPELGALADDINSLAARLDATEQHRAALIGDVAHEMRTPLTTITGYLEGFHDGLFSAEEMATTVDSEIARLHHLARDLAAVSRSDEGQVHLDLAAEDVGDLLRTVAARVEQRYAAAGVSLSLTVPERLVATLDRERMIQALTNLLTNALAYTPSGGRVAIAAHATDALRIRVSDTGRGLRPDECERIFERFYRSDPHDHSGGTGIGLTISRGIVRAHGGELTATSAGPGRGATFEIVLPLP